MCRLLIKITTGKITLHMDQIQQDQQSIYVVK